MLSSTQTHATLLARLAQGQDPGVWSEFVSRYGELIRGFAKRQNLQAADIDDVQQDVLMSLAQAMPQFRYDPAKGKFRSYLKTVVIHSIYRRSRQNRPHADLQEVEAATRAACSDADIDALWETQWRQYHLRMAMRVIDAEFNEADRAAFEQYAVVGRDVREVASDVGLTVDQVYQAKSRITRRLSALIEQQVADEG